MLCPIWGFRHCPSTHSLTHSLSHPLFSLPPPPSCCVRFGAHFSPPGAKPFRLFVIINFCCGLNLTDAVLLYERFHNHSCAHVEPTTSRPMFSSWGAVQSKRPFAVEAARWEVGFFAPIAAARLPRPFFLPFIYPANYTNAETPTLAQQQAIVAGMGSTIDGLWYWGCAPLADAVAASSGATVAACRAAGKFVATPVSGPYSPHSKYNNRYSNLKNSDFWLFFWDHFFLTDFSAHTAPRVAVPCSLDADWCLQIRCRGQFALSGTRSRAAPRP